MNEPIRTAAEMREAAAQAAETRWEKWHAGDGVYDSEGLCGVECDVTACKNIAAAIRALPIAPEPAPVTRVYEPYPGAFDHILGPDTEDAPDREALVELVRDALPARQCSGEPTCPGNATCLCRDEARAVLAALEAAGGDEMKPDRVMLAMIIVSWILTTGMIYFNEALK